MPLSSVDYVVTNPGSAGAKLPGETYTDSGDGIVKFLPFMAMTWGTQNGTYDLVNDTTPFPVTVKNSSLVIADGGNVISVDDNGSSITVDGTITAKNQDGAGNDLVSSTAAPGASDRGLIVRTVGGVDQGTAAAAASAWPFKISDGTTTATISTISAIKALDVNIAGGVGGSSMVDDAVFTTGTSSVTVAAGTYRSSRDAVDDNDAGGLAMTSKRALLVSLETVNGDPVTDDGINAVKTMILDATGNQITSFGGGVQYIESEVDASITGTAMMWEDTSDTLRPVSAAKPLPVNIISGGGSGGTSLGDSGSFVFSTTSFTPVGGVYHGTRDAMSAGEAGAFAVTPKRAMYATLETPDSDSVMDDTENALKTIETRPGTATLANVASSATSVTLLAANASRRGAMIVNDSTEVLYVKFGVTASSSSFTVKMSAGDYYELPQPCYFGRLDGIWASANGSARMTELSA